MISGEEVWGLQVKLHAACSPTGSHDTRDTQNPPRPLGEDGTEDCRTGGLLGFPKSYFSALMFSLTLVSCSWRSAPQFWSTGTHLRSLANMHELRSSWNFKTGAVFSVCFPNKFTFRVYCSTDPFLATHRQVSRDRSSLAGGSASPPLFHSRAHFPSSPELLPPVVALFLALFSERCRG